MAQRTFGNITVIFPDGAAPSAQAGTMDENQQRDVAKAWDGVAHAAVATSGVMLETPGIRVSMDGRGRALDNVRCVLQVRAW